MTERLMLVGEMARDDAFTAMLDSNIVLNVASGHIHPSLKQKAEKSGGQFMPLDINKSEAVVDFANSCSPTLVIVSGDKPLYAGVVDALMAANPELPIASPDSHSFLLESDKEYARKLNIDIGRPELNPFYLSAHNDAEIDEMVAEFKRRGLTMVVKPRGPTGGRGVQVMGRPDHFQTYEEGAAYAKAVLKEDPSQPGILFEEELIGPEFNLQIYTDGLVFIEPPVTIDFPYRHDGDSGLGTGGTGSMNFRPGELPPFLTAEDYIFAMDYVKQFIAAVRASGLDPKGVAYPNFVLTAEGIKLIEYNLRRGDPEWINIEAVTDPDVDRFNVNMRIARQELRNSDVSFRDLASTVIYFMARDYPKKVTNFKPSSFELNPEILKDYDVNAYFSSSRQVGPNRYETVSNSRAVALEAEGSTPWEARAKILEAKSAGGITGDLDNREDPGSQEYINSFLQDPRS